MDGHRRTNGEMQNEHQRERERHKKKDMKRSAERNGTGRRGTERVTDVPAEVS